MTTALDEDQIVMSLRELGAAVLPLNIREDERRDAVVNQVRRVALSVGRRYGFKLATRECHDCLVIWNRADGEEPGPEPVGLRGAVPALLARYEAGETLEQLGEEWGVTRERMRQLFDERRGSSRDHVRASREARQRRKLEQAEVHKDKLVALYRKHGSIKAAIDEAVATLGLVRRVATDVLEANLTDTDRRMYRGSMSTPAPDERRAEYIGYIQAAARLTGNKPLGFKDYNKVAEFFGWPSHQTLTKYFGDERWSAACEAAGVEGRTPHRGYKRTWTRETCEQAVLQVADDLGHYPTCEEYEFMARASQGALPSLATVRTRCGKWNQIIKRLLPTWEMSR